MDLQQPPEPTAAPPLTAGALWTRGKLIVRKLGPAGPLAVVSAFLPALGFLTLLFMLNMLGTWLRDHHELGILVYVIACAVFTGCAILPTNAFSILAGWAFGFQLGAPLAVAGILFGALGGYGLARSLVRDRITRLIEAQPKWRVVHRELLGGGFWKTAFVVLLIRLPYTPFAIANLALAAMGVRLAPYLVGTLIGVAPRTAGLVFLSAGVHTLTFEDAPHSPGHKWLLIGSMLATFLAVAIIAQWANRALKRMGDADAAPPAPVIDSGPPPRA